MQKTSRASTPRSTRRPVVWACAIASSAALLSAVGCRIEATPPPDATSGTTGAGAGGALGGSGTSSTGGSAGTSSSGGVTSTGGTGGAVGGSGGVGTGGTLAGSGGVGTGGTLAGSAGTGGAVAGSGGVGTGGTLAGGAGTGGAVAGSGGASNGGMGGAARPCVDVQPPPTAEWPDATCENWANETTECTAAWFATYCDVSCGRCVPEGGGAGAGGAAGVDCSTQGLPNVTGGNGYATRYWDCCQTHCSQFDGKRCSQDGTSSTGSTQSACSGGDSFACYDEAPRSVSECLSYGHIAKANPNCGGCFRIQFTGEGQYNANDPGSKLIKGKQMIVKVTNTGGDVAGGQFDLMVPGGGVGQFNACSRQWGTTDLGAQYGGFLTECTGTHAAKKECVRQECMKIPAGTAREGCIWFVDWFQVADNPKFTSEATNCPF